MNERKRLKTNVGMGGSLFTTFQNSKYEDLILFLGHSKAGHIAQEEKLLVKAPVHIPDRHSPLQSPTGNLSNLEIRV